MAFYTTSLFIKFESQIGNQPPDQKQTFLLLCHSFYQSDSFLWRNGEEIFAINLYYHLRRATNMHKNQIMAQCSVRQAISDDKAAHLKITPHLKGNLS